MPVAEHHDGFQMYDSAISEWNSARMGPKVDVLGELKRAADKEGLAFCVSNHRAENYFFYAGGRDFDSGIKDIAYEEPYGYACRAFSTPASIDATQDIGGEPASEEHLAEWLARNCEIVDKYRPRIVWFDWWIQNLSFKPYIKKFAAYYYNRAEEWGAEVAINYKYDAFMYSSAVFDIERGQLSGIASRLWQNDTAMAKNSWGYTEGNEFKDPADLVRDLVDIVSKNGCLLLNVGPKSDGGITEEEQGILRSIGAWLRANGEAIYDSSCWTRYGEGLTAIAEGAFADTARPAFTSEDIRFTFKAPWLYATVLRWPEDNRVLIRSLRLERDNHELCFKGQVSSVSILGHENSLEFNRGPEGLAVAVDGRIDSPFPVCLKIKLD